MKAILNYPHDFRPPPQFLLDVPADWRVVEFPGALYAVSSVDPESPWINVVVAHERIVAGDHDRVFIERGRQLGVDLTGFEVELEKEFSLKNDPKLFKMRQAAYSESGVRTRHFEVSTIAPNRLGLTVNDLFTITFLFPLDAVGHYQQFVLETLQSFRFA